MRYLTAISALLVSCSIAMAQRPHQESRLPNSHEWFGILFLGATIIGYVSIPFIVAMCRRHPWSASILIVSCFGPMGWLAGMALALMPLASAPPIARPVRRKRNRMPCPLPIPSDGIYERRQRLKS